MFWKCNPNYCNSLQEIVHLDGHNLCYKSLFWKCNLNDCISSRNFQQFKKKHNLDKVLQNFDRKIRSTPKLSIPKWELNLGIMQVLLYNSHTLPLDVGMCLSECKLRCIQCGNFQYLLEFNELWLIFGKRIVIKVYN